MGKLSKLTKKRKEAAARKAKAAADAAAAADATEAAAAAAATAAASAAADADAAADAASRAAAAAVVPAAPSGSGSAATSNRVNICRSHAAAVANGPVVAVNVAGETTSVVAASVAFPSSAATKSSKKAKLSAAVAFSGCYSQSHRQRNTSSRSGSSHHGTEDEFQDAWRSCCWC